MSAERERWEARRAAEVATRRAVLARDAGLQRISRVTRWMVGGVVGLSGGLALLAAGAFHGHTIKTTPPASPSSGSSGGTTTSTTTPTTTTPATTTPAAATPATTTPSQSSGLQPPSQAPTAAPTPAPVVVSGGS